MSGRLSLCCAFPCPCWAEQRCDSHTSDRCSPMMSRTMDTGQAGATWWIAAAARRNTRSGTPSRQAGIGSLIAVGPGDADAGLVTDHHLGTEQCRQGRVSAGVEYWFARTFRTVLASCGVQNAGAQERETCPAVHGSLDGLHAVDLPLGWARGPRRVEGGLHGREVRERRAERVSEDAVEAPAALAAQQATEALRRAPAPARAVGSERRGLLRARRPALTSLISPLLAVMAARLLPGVAPFRRWSWPSPLCGASPTRGRWYNRR